MCWRPRHGRASRPGRLSTMSGKRTDIWFAGSIGITAAVAVGAFAIGFVWLPLADPTARFHGAWNAICAAAGLVQTAPDLQPIQQATYPVTQVEVSPQMLRDASADSIGSGATLALRCTMCHGPRGLSQAQAPNLAGQYAVAIYKQLTDFKNGARPSAVMEPLACGSDRLRYARPCRLLRLSATPVGSGFERSAGDRCQRARRCAVSPRAARAMERSEPRPVRPGSVDSPRPICTLS